MSAAPTHHTSDTRAAAAYLGVASGTLRNLRSRGRGPVFYRIGRSIVYRRVDLDAFLAACRVEPSV